MKTLLILHIGEEVLVESGGYQSLLGRRFYKGVPVNPPQILE